MKNGNKYWLMTAAASAFIAMFALITSIFLTTMWVNEKTWQEGYLTSRLDTVHRVIMEVNQALDDLIQQGATECNDATLFSMKRELLKSRYILDIGFLESNKIICGAVPGIFNPPVTIHSKPTFTTANGLDVYVDRRLEHPIYKGIHDSAIAMTRGQFGVAISPTDIQAYITGNHTVHIYYQTKNAYGARMVFTLMGPEEVYEAGETNKLRFTNAGIYRDICAPETGFCAATLTTFTKIISRQKPTFFLMIFASLVGGLASFYFTLSHLMKRPTVEWRARKGLQNGSYYWLYQPIVHLKSQRIIGCEALARFEDELGPLSPAEFIPIIKRDGLSFKFSTNMIRKIEEDFNGLNMPKGFKMSLNIYPSDIDNGNVLKLFDHSPLAHAPCDITLEITEEDYLEHDFSLAVLRKLSKAGYSLSIDDFGTGYSNLARIESLNCDFLKIDRSFVQDVHTKGLKSSLIPQIVQIAKKFNLKIIAEGIENEDQYQILLQQGVEFGQGWYFGKPVSAEEIKDLCANKDLAANGQQAQATPSH